MPLRMHDSHGRRPVPTAGFRIIGSSIHASQLPVDRWHATIGVPTYADAILDHIVHNAIRLPLKGKSMREPETDNDVDASGSGVLDTWK